MDGFGCGETKDAHRFNDEGAYTSLHILQNYQELKRSYLYEIGLFHCQENASYCYPQNPNKDTFSCTQEMFGTIMGEFRTFPEGFPLSIVHNLESLIGSSLLGNIAMSGTKIIKQLGEESLHKGSPIIYTSADSVMQFAAHTDSFPLSRLYYLCEIACNMYCHDLPLGRVIARPFKGNSAETFYRTDRRKDFVYPTPSNILLERNCKTVVYKSFATEFSQKYFKTILHLIPGKTNDSLYSYFLQMIQEPPSGKMELYLIKLEDFDMRMVIEEIARIW